MPPQDLLSCGHTLGQRGRVISNEPQVIQLNVLEGADRHHREHQQKLRIDLVIVILVVEHHLILKRGIDLVAWLVVHHLLRGA